MKNPVFGVSDYIYTASAVFFVQKPVFVSFLLRFGFVLVSFWFRFVF